MGQRGGGGGRHTIIWGWQEDGIAMKGAQSKVKWGDAMGGWGGGGHGVNTYIHTFCVLFLYAIKSLN